MTTYIATLHIHGRRSLKASTVKITETNSSPEIEALLNWSTTMLRFHGFEFVDYVALTIKPSPDVLMRVGTAIEQGATQ